MDLLKLIRIAVIGLPDGGKSTFIKNVVKVITNKEISTDTLMNEVHYSDGHDIYGNDDTRTIKCAKIFFKFKEYEICMYDCPGHIEYAEQIILGINGASVIIKLIDVNRINESWDYYKNKIFTNICNKQVYTLFSHSDEYKINHYNVFNVEAFTDLAYKILDEIYSKANLNEIEIIDIEEESKKLINDILLSYNNIGMFFSGGKDSLVGLHLLKMTNNIDKVSIYFPDSHDDFPEVLLQVDNYAKIYNITILHFDNNFGYSPDKVSMFDWMMYKAKSNNKLIEKEKLDLVLVQYRASDEGVRSKDYHIVNKGNHYRFSPVFYFSESNIWRFIKKYNLPICELYYKGYRSLGDSCCTVPCMDTCKNIDEIIKFIEEHPNTNERDGRTKQDKSSSFTMEKIRNCGFF